MQKNVEIVLGRLLTDVVLRRRFAEQPRVLLEELDAQGFELSPVEVDALSGTSIEALEWLARALDARLRRAALTPKFSGETP